MSAPYPHQSAGDSYSQAQMNQLQQDPVTSRKKKGGFLKWGGLTVAGLVLLGAITNGTGGDEENSPAAATTTITSTSPAAAADTQFADTPEPTTSSMTTFAEPSATEDSPETFAEAAVDTQRVPAEFSSALSKASFYANHLHMSKQGLYGQLTSEYGEGFSAEAAQYAVDRVEANWNANALEKAYDYQDMNMSPSAIHDQLTSAYGEEFTQAEAGYALANLNGGTTAGGAQNGTPVEFTSALAKADSYANGMNMSRQGVYDQLVSGYGEQFSADAAQYAIDNVQADWNANALAKARSYQDMDMSPAAIHNQLTSTYGEEFTQAQADFALANL